jgi:hypothetical protein
MQKNLKTISHLRTFRITDFFYEKIGLEDNFPSDKPDEECIQELHDRIEAMARRVYPDLFPKFGNFQIYMPTTGKMEERWLEATSEVAQQAKQFPLEPKDVIQQPLGITEEMINSCKSLTVLTAYEKLIAKQPEVVKIQLKKVYDKKVKELSKQTV